MIDCDNIKRYIYPYVGILYNVHKELGPGLNEVIYQEGLEIELSDQNIDFEREKIFHPLYKGITMKSTYRLDFLVNSDIIIELKAVSDLTDDHRAQLFNYMYMVKPVAGLLVNFAGKACVVERYFFDLETNTICNVDGIPIRRKK